MSDFHAVMMGGRSRPSQDEMVAEDFPPTQSSLHQSGALWAGERGGGGEARDFSIAPVVILEDDSRERSRPSPSTALLYSAEGQVSRKNRDRDTETRSKREGQSTSQPSNIQDSTHTTTASPGPSKTTQKPQKEKTKPKRQAPQKKGNPSPQTVTALSDSNTVTPSSPLPTAHRTSPSPGDAQSSPPPSSPDTQRRKTANGPSPDNATAPQQPRTQSESAAVYRQSPSQSRLRPLSGRTPQPPRPTSPPSPSLKKRGAEGDAKKRLTQTEFGATLERMEGWHRRYEANKVERATGQMMQEMRDVTGRPQITKKSVDLASGFESIRGRVASIIAKREERIRSMRTEEDERELLEIRRPQINSVSEGLVRTTEDLFHFERRKLEKRKQAAQMKEIDSMRGVTFSPQINTASRRIAMKKHAAKAQLTTGQRLFEASKTRAAHLAELADHFAASFKFAPEISEKSKKIAVSRRPEGETVAVGERLYSHRLQPRGDPGGEAEGGADARRSDSNQKRDRHLAECFKGNGKAKEDGGAVRVFGIVRHNCGAASPVRFSFRPQTRGVPGRPLEKSGQANSSAISQNCPVTSLQFDPSLSFLLSTLKARGQNLAT